MTPLRWYECLLQYLYLAGSLYLVTWLFIRFGPAKLREALAMAGSAEVRAKFQPYMEGLRGLMAVNIFFIHCVVMYETPRLHRAYPLDIFNQELGITALTYFFAMTGYLVWKTVMEQGRTMSVKRFLRGRFYRLFPAYGVVITGIFLFGFARQGWRLAVPLWKLLASYVAWLAFSIPGGPAINGIGLTTQLGAGVMWTLQMDWMFYLTIPVLVFFGWNYQRRWGWAWMALIAGGLYIGLSSLHASITSPLLLRLQLLMFYFVTGFCPGMLLAHIKLRWPVWPFARTRIASVIAVSLMLGVCCFTPFEWDWSFWHAMFLMPAFVLMAYGCDLFGFLSSGPALLLGRISYSMYLIHALVLELIAFFVLRFAHYDVLALPWPKYVLLTVPFGLLMLVLSFLSHQFIELPCTTLGRRRSVRALANIGTPEHPTREQVHEAIQEEAAQLPGQAEAEGLLPQHQPQILR